jgi:hypothetical protein
MATTARGVVGFGAALYSVNVENAKILIAVTYTRKQRR